MKISLLMPSLDRDFIADAVDSVVAQPHEDWELLVLGNGGPKPYARDPRIRYSTDNYSGPCKLNTLMDFAAGDVFNFAADDDTLTPDALGAVAGSIGDAAWLVGRIVTSDGVVAGHACAYEELLESNHLPCPAVYWTRRAAQVVGAFEPRLAGDYDYWLRLWEAFGPPVFIGDVLSVYRVWPGQESTLRAAEVVADAEAVRRKHMRAYRPAQII